MLAAFIFIKPGIQVKLVIHAAPPHPHVGNGQLGEQRDPYAEVSRCLFLGKTPSRRQRQAVVFHVSCRPIPCGRPWLPSPAPWPGACQQKFLATKPDHQGATNLGLAQGFFLDGQLLVVERTLWQWREVIRALNGVVAVKDKLEFHDLLLVEFRLRDPHIVIDDAGCCIAKLGFDLVEVFVDEFAELTTRAGQGIENFSLLKIQFLSHVKIYSINLLAEPLRQIGLQIIKRCREKVGNDLGAGLCRIQLTQGCEFCSDVHRESKRELALGQPGVVWAAPDVVKV